MSSLPTISVCIPTYNSAKSLGKCLKRVRSQDYPQSKIEIILGDGGSTDSTVKIAKKYKAKIIKIPPNKQHAEYNRGVAFNKAKNDLVLIIDHDNFLPSKNWISRMIKPFLDNPKLVAATTLHYHYSPKYSLIDRYFSLYGTSEPLPYFLGKADRMPQYITTWNSHGEKIDKGGYILVNFPKDPRKFPSIGSNGTLMRRALVKKHAKADPDNHYPIDVMYDMVEKGYSQFAFVKNSIIHLTNMRGFISFISRRKNFVDKYHFQDKSKRRWSVVMKGDETKLVLYVLYSATLLGPLIEALRGYMKIRDKAWFVYPLMCLLTTLVYVQVTLKNLLFR